LLEAAEGADADSGGKVAVDFTACRDGYGALAGMFGAAGAGSADADPADEDRDSSHARARDGEVDHRKDFAPGKRVTTADSRRGMAQDLRRAAALPDLDEVFPQTPQRGSANARVSVSELDDIFAPVSP
jgi:hypothetical protein